MEKKTAYTLEELETLQVFQSVDLETIEPSLRDCGVLELDVGDVLIEAGEHNRYLYLILSGKLSIHVKSADTPSIATVGVGESVGELSLIDNQSASAFVVAREPTRVLAVDEELMWLLADTSHPVSYNLLSTLARRLRYGNQVISEDREKLYEYQFQATIDGLTGLYNRHWLNTMLPRMAERAQRCQEPFALVMADIDHFKKYNDTHGHLGGDRALCTVADTLRGNLRPADMAARYGGEEFTVLLPTSDLEDARGVAERLRDAVSKAEIASSRGAELSPVTLSLGIAQIHDGQDTEAFLGEADAALYRAKLAGRNCVCV